MAAFPSLPASEADQLLREEFGRRVEVIGFRPAERRWSWVRSGKAPIIEEIGIGALKGYGFHAGWSAQLTFVPHVTRGGNVRPGPAAALSIDPLDHPERYDLARLTTTGFRSARQFRSEAGIVASYATSCATAWFDRITDVASLLPIFAEQMAAPVTRFGFENYPDQRLALAFVHGYLGDLTAAHRELDHYLGRGGFDITEQQAARLRASLERRLSAAAPTA